jgi:hypothetical protein
MFKGTGLFRVKDIDLSLDAEGKEHKKHIFSNFKIILFKTMKKVLFSCAVWIPHSIFTVLLTAL